MSVAVSIASVREFSGPNLYRPAPVIEARLAIAASDEWLASPPRREIAKIDAAVEEYGLGASLAGASGALFPGEELPPAPRSAGERALLGIAERVATIAQRFQTIVGCSGSFARGRLSRDAGELLAVIASPHVEVAREAFRAAATLTSAALAGVSFDRPAAFRALVEAVRAAETLPSAAAMAQACARRGIPYRRLDSCGAALVGQGAKARRVCGLQTDETGAVSAKLASDTERLLKQLASFGLPVHTGDGKAALGQERQEEFRLFVVRGKLAAAIRISPAGGQRALRNSGRLRDVTDFLHRETAVLAIDAAKLAGFETAAIDILARRIDEPLERQHGAILRLHAAPELSPTIPGAAELLRPVAERVLDGLFPESNGRIPIVAVTGVNGKTTTTRLIAHILAACGHVVGMTCTEGIYLASRRIEAGDCSGPQSAGAVLTHPQVDAAALETARGGILRAGLGFDVCDVAVVTNIGEGDHLGLAGIETPAQLARVKRTLVEAVAARQGHIGAAVLNADDELVAAMAPYCPGGVVYFSRRTDHRLLVESRKRQGRVAFVRDGAIVLAEGDAEFTLLALDRIPLTHRGRIGFQVENSLAATAAAWALGKPCELIRLGLETFSAGLCDLPGRFNLLDFRGATVIVDYGHNASSLAAIVQAIEHFPHTRRMAVYSAAGDRRDSDLVRQGEVLGEAFDAVVLFEDNYRRGRAAGEIMGLFRQGLTKATRTRAIDEALSWRQAVELALTRAAPGDLLVVQADEIDDTVEWLQRRFKEDSGLREIEPDRANAVPRRPTASVGA